MNRLVSTEVVGVSDYLIAPVIVVEKQKFN